MKSPRDHDRELRAAWRRYVRAANRGDANAAELSRIYGEKHGAWVADFIRRKNSKHPITIKISFAD